MSSASPATMPIRVAISGARGIPALYGGFETFAEELAPRLVQRGFDVTVYCRQRYSDASKPRSFRGVRLVYLPAIGLRALESPSAELLCSLHALKERPDILYVLGFRASAVYWPHRVVGRTLAFNTDGFDWQRSKWGSVARRYLRISAGLGVRLAPDGLVADSKVTAEYYARTYKCRPTYLSYGAPLLTTPSPETVASYGLESGRYYLVVARVEPENHVKSIIEGYLRSGSAIPLAVVGSQNYGTPYGDSVRDLQCDRVRLLGGVYASGHLDALYQGCLAYVHGHEVGGTNPSLVRAMGAGALVLANGVSYNREVLADAGVYWSPELGDLPRVIQWVESDPALADRLRVAARTRAAQHYSWEAIADGYAEYFSELAGRPVVRRDTLLTPAA